MSGVVNDKVKDFWENNHRPGNIAWLAKPDIMEVYKNHNILKLINGSKKLNIMEIGVGVAESIQYLVKKHNVTAVDISSAALKKVEKIAKTYLTNDMSSIPSESIDLAFSNLVIQHCSEEMVCFLMEQTLRVLRTDGMFSFQNGYCRKMFDSLEKECFSNGVRVLFLDRDENKIKEIIEKSGGKIVGCPKSIDLKRNNMTWNFFHIKKA